MTVDDKTQAYVAGQMTPQERAEFEADVQADPNLAAEVAVAQAARTAFSDEDARAAKRAEQGWARLEAEIAPRALPQPANDNRPVWRGWVQTAAAVVVAVGLWQVIAVPQISGNDDGFVPVSASTQGPALQVIFAETAELGDVVALLSDLDGIVIDGPGALGLFRISFADEAARDSARAALQSNTDLVMEVMVD